jgi:NAD(P)-dependent dehydrogenase (short-subunit alcohol dehydrogenase family)
MQKGQQKKKLRPDQEQSRPGSEQKMRPRPVFDYPGQPGSGKLAGKVALITGGDSGIGKAVAVLFAKEGAEIAIAYLNEHKDAKETAEYIKTFYNKDCLLVAGDLGNEKHCVSVVSKVYKRFGRVDILVNNAAQQFEKEDISQISSKQLLRTFSINIFSFFWLSRECIPLMAKGSAIINSSSVTAYRGSANLLDYSSTKGAIVSFTRSLAANLIKKGIRVNGVAPGPVWTPLIPSSFKGKKVAQHGSDAPMGRAGEPAEIAPAYLFLASNDAQYISGQFIHPNGGEIVNG